jgi:DNA-binding GntR family transcriptional regulator
MGLAIETVEQRIFSALRAEIVRGVLRPDAPLRLIELSERLGVSTTPIRGAIRRLESEGLARTSPHRGARVAPLELEDLEEVQAVRCAVEGFAVRLGAERLTDADLEHMRQIFDRLSAVAPDRDLDAYLVLQWDLHDVCYQKSERIRLLELITVYRLRAERYIRLVIGSKGGFEGSIELQRRFLAACGQRDGNRAEREICDGLEWTVRGLAHLRTDLSPLESS